MEKRVDKNKFLYQNIALNIEKEELKEKGKEIEETSKTLSMINPELFKGKANKKDENKNLKTIIALVVTILILVALIIIMGFKLYGK